MTHLQSQIDDKQAIIDAELAKVEEEKEQNRAVRQSMCNYFDLGRHDLNLFTNATRFTLIEQQK